MQKMSDQKRNMRHIPTISITSNVLEYDDNGK